MQTFAIKPFFDFRDESWPSEVSVDLPSKSTDSFAALAYTMQAAKSPSLWAFSNAGDITSVLLNQMRARAMHKIENKDGKRYSTHYTKGCGLERTDASRFTP